MKEIRKPSLALGIALCAPLAWADGLLALDNPAKNGAATAAYAGAEAFEGNDQVAMRQYGKDWKGDYTPRADHNIGLLTARAEAGVQWDGYRLGTLYRAIGLAQANRDTADLLRQYKTDSGYDSGRSYLVDARVGGFEADGVRLGKRFALEAAGGWQIDWGGAGALLRGRRVRVDTAGGQVVAQDTRDVNAGAIWSSTDSRTDTSGAGAFNPPYGARPAWSGQGFAVDTGIVLRRQDGLTLEAAVNDLAGRMSWKNLPLHVINYNSANKYYDADGTVHFNALASARSGYLDLSQRLAPKVWLAAGYPLGAFDLQATGSFTRGYWFPELGAIWRIAPQWRLGGGYDVHFKTVALTLRHRWFYAGLRTANLDLTQARAYGAQGGLNIPF